MATNDPKNGLTGTDAEMLAQAKEIIKQARAAERERKRQEAIARGEVPPEKVSWPHVLLRQLVEYLVTANGMDDASFKDAVMQIVPFLDTASEMPSITTARDFEYTSKLIETTAKRTLKSSPTVQ